MPTTFYVLEAAVDQCTAEFYVNDIPIVRLGPGIGRYYGGPVNSHLIDGVNELAIVINPGATPSLAVTGDAGERQRSATRESRAIGKLTRYPFGAVVGGPQGVDLIIADWKGPEEEAPVVFPRVAAGQADLGELYGPWEWQDAGKIMLDETTAGEIKPVLEKLRESLAAANPGPFLELGRTRMKESARAFGFSVAEKERLIRTNTRQESSHAGWGLQPLNEARFDLRLCAEDRMVEAVAKDWEAILRENPDAGGRSAYYTMMLSRIGGEWAIVR